MCFICCMNKYEQNIWFYMCVWKCWILYSIISLSLSLYIYIYIYMCVWLWMILFEILYFVVSLYEKLCSIRFCVIWLWKLDGGMFCTCFKVFVHKIIALHGNNWFGMCYSSAVLKSNNIHWHRCSWYVSLSNTKASVSYMMSAWYMWFGWQMSPVIGSKADTLRG